MNNLKMTELCPKCGKPTSTKITTEAKLTEELLTNRPLVVSPLCQSCMTQPTNSLIEEKLKEFDKISETAEWGYEFDAKAMRPWLNSTLKEIETNAKTEVALETVRWLRKQLMTEEGTTSNGYAQWHNSMIENICDWLKATYSLKSELLTKPKEGGEK